MLKLTDNRVCPSAEDLRKLYDECGSWSREDHMRIFYLCILGTALVCADQRMSIPLDIAKRVMNLDLFKQYPWGRISYLVMCVSGFTII